MSDKASLLIVEDDEGSRLFLQNVFKKTRYQVDASADGEEAIKKIRTNEYDIILTDLDLGNLSGIDILKEAKLQNYSPEVVVITAYGTVESAVEAIKLEAFDYLLKPVDSKRVVLAVNNALERKRLRSEVISLRNQLGKRYSRENIIAESSKMRRLLDLIDHICETDSTVLIEGESGTGKELVAKAIHYGSSRAGKPFIPVNCAALPESLLESELFGHVKGAFTGAIRDKKGLFEEAHSGTILLDEIGDMPLTIQVKFLRVLEERKIRRVGGNQIINIDVRIIAATNRDLKDLMKEGKFREDLFYRLNVIPVTIPPLCERKEDIAPLTNHFLEIYSANMKKETVVFIPETLEILKHYDWPGNVRELENLVERVVALSKKSVIKPSDLALVFQFDGKKSADLAEDFDERDLSKMFTLLEQEYREKEREYIVRALEENNYNQSQAARTLGISRQTIWAKMKKYGIDIQLGIQS
ncbi:MAG: sigma-54-dependent Fis family transcriptional regulator [Spirochaetes bacterium]|nr:sigma-54-dependent Fis family transcriptional regulator [Spirochaetota bacterium]